MPVTYQQEFLVTTEKDARPLLEKHWQEIAVNKEHIKLNPDWEAYADLEASGNLKIFTARDGSALVGYFVVFVRNHIHYKDHLFAHNDILFLSEPYRKGFTGIKLIKFAEECLKADGVSVLTINTKTHKPFDGVLQRLGFNHVENIYSKLLRS
jgi:GNAT superfamily N-acetyltransferase